MKHTVDQYYFPGFVRKAVTFTIDDGNIENDRKFIDIVRPAGIRGTFNLCAPERLSPEEYRAFYKGFEIANHVKYHPAIFNPAREYVRSNAPFDVETSDVMMLHPHPEADGVWFVNDLYYGREKSFWYRIATVDAYIRLIDETHTELENVFGEGSVRSFVWPFGKQKDFERVLAHVAKKGYYAARGAGRSIDSFDMPSDRMDWRYCASDSSLLAKMERFDALPDDGTLKFFAFGVHSIDYERAGKWGELLAFAEQYGNRRENFYYATVGEIFAYEDAINALQITDEAIVNKSSLPLYVKIDGTPVIITVGETLRLK